VFDSANINKQVQSQYTDRLPYLRTMGETDVSLFQIPGRIIHRYVDNFRFLIDKVLALVSGRDDSASIAVTADPYGIKKTLVLLTKPNKVIAVSSYNGAVKWSFYNRQPILKIYVEQEAGSNLVHDVIVVTEKAVIYLDP
jgi:hypothetical protein